MWGASFHSCLRGCPGGPLWGTGCWAGSVCLAGSGRAFRAFSWQGGFALDCHIAFLLTPPPPTPARCCSSEGLFGGDPQQLQGGVFERAQKPGAKGVSAPQPLWCGPDVGWLSCHPEGSISPNQTLLRLAFGLALGSQESAGSWGCFGGHPPGLWATGQALAAARSDAGPPLPAQLRVQRSGWW